MRKNLTLGIFGFGCVGQGLYDVLHHTQGFKTKIKKVCVKDRNKQRSADQALFTYDKYDILNDDEINVVVELIDDANAAFEILKESLKRGKAVVTANKKMLAENLEEIYQLQQKYNTPVLYEGSVCASIPIIRNLEEYYDNDLLQRVEGIFNGSTNYILTKIFEEGMDYDTALAEAQRLGFAETDPSLDVRGFDARYKLCIVIAHAFGVFVNPESIVCFGIDKLNKSHFDYAREKGYAIKLVARAFKQTNQIHALVAPQFVKSDHEFYPIKYEYNAVSVRGAFSEKQLFVGKGAGSRPTASAVLSDISALSFGYRYEYRKLIQNTDSFLSSDGQAALLLSDEVPLRVALTAFKEIYQGYAGKGKHYINGVVSLNTLADWAESAILSPVLWPDNFENLSSMPFLEAERLAS